MTTIQVAMLRLKPYIWTHSWWQASKVCIRKLCRSATFKHYTGSLVDYRRLATRVSASQGRRTHFQQKARCRCHTGNEHLGCTAQFLLDWLSARLSCPSFLRSVCCLVWSPTGWSHLKRLQVRRWSKACEWIFHWNEWTEMDSWLDKWRSI